jgi:hypothetical protein
VGLLRYEGRRTRALAVRVRGRCMLFFAALPLRARLIPPVFFLVRTPELVLPVLSVLPVFWCAAVLLPLPKQKLGEARLASEGGMPRVAAKKVVKRAEAMAKVKTSERPYSEPRSWGGGGSVLILSMGCVEDGFWFVCALRKEHPFFCGESCHNISPKCVGGWLNGWRGWVGGRVW